MNEIFNYLLRSGACMALFYAFYWLLLRKDTYFALNRVYLLLSLVVSMIFPLINITFSVGSEQAAMFLLEPVIINQEILKETIQAKSGYFRFAEIIYIGGAALIFVRLIYRLLQIGLMANRQKIKHEAGIKTVILPPGHTPFSFFKVLFITEELLESTHLEEILAHEKVHIKQGHSVDLLFIELLSVLQWFNPFIWMYHASIKNQHEYLADDGVLRQGYARKNYQHLLLNQTFGLQLNTLSNNFNHSLIKTRFKMMTKEKTGRSVWFKLSMILPAAMALAILVSVSFTEKLVAQADEPIITTQETFQPIAEDQEKDPVFVVVEVMPEYPGGSEAMLQFIRENIKYPEAARDAGKQGTVYVTFIVEKNGEVSDVKVLRGFEEECDAEALRVIKMMQAWKPGQQRGQAVRTQFNLPIKFKLDKEVEKTE